MKKKYKNEYVNAFLLKATRLYSPDIDFDTNLSEILDSLDSVELIMEIEKEFDIQISDEHAEEILVEGFTLKDVKKDLEKSYGIFDIKERRKEKIDNINKNQ